MNQEQLIKVATKGIGANVANNQGDAFTLSLVIGVLFEFGRFGSKTNAVRMWLAFRLFSRLRYGQQNIGIGGELDVRR